MANTFVAAHLSTFAAFARSNFQDSLSVLVRPSFRQLLGSRSYSHSPPCRSYLSPRPASRRCSSWRLPPCVSSRLVSSRLIFSFSLFVLQRCDLVYRRPRLHGVLREQSARRSRFEESVLPSYFTKETRRSKTQTERWRRWEEKGKKGRWGEGGKGKQDSEEDAGEAPVREHASVIRQRSRVAWRGEFDDVDDDDDDDRNVPLLYVEISVRGYSLDAFAR